MYSAKKGPSERKMSAYAGEFVMPTHQAAKPAAARPRRGSDPTVSATAQRTEANGADRTNPRLPYQLQPNARPRVLATPDPYPGSPAAALRGQVYERLEELALLLAHTPQLPPDITLSPLAGNNVGSLAYMLPLIRGDGDKRAHSDIIQEFAKQSIRLECRTEELVNVLCAAVFAFEVYRLGEPEFMSSVSMLDEETRAVEAALASQQDEAASDLRKLIRAADAKMSAVRTRLAVASTPARALAKFHEVVSILVKLFPQSTVRPALVEVSNDVLSVTIGTHVAQLHRLAEQAGMLYTRQCGRLVVKRQRQVEMLGRRLAHCAERLRSPGEADDDVAATATRKARRMFAESIRQMKKIGEDVEQVVAALCQAVRDPSLVDSDVLGAGVNEAVRGLETQLELVRAAIGRELEVAATVPMPEKTPAAEQPAADAASAAGSREQSKDEGVVQQRAGAEDGFSVGGGAEAIAALANGVAAAALCSDSDEERKKSSSNAGSDAGSETGGDPWKKKKPKRKNKKKNGGNGGAGGAAGGGGGGGQGQQPRHRRAQSEPVFAGYIPGIHEMMHQQQAAAVQMHQQQQMQLIFDPADGSPSWEAGMEGMDPYAGMSPMYSYQRSMPDAAAYEQPMMVPGHPDMADAAAATAAAAAAAAAVAAGDRRGQLGAS